MSWPKVALDELTHKIGSGSTPRGGNSSYKDAGIPLVRSMNVHDGVFKAAGLAFIDEEQARLLQNVTLQKGDVLINITGASVARSCILPERYSGGRVNQHVAIIRPKQELNPAYLNYFLTATDTKRNLLNTAAGGATREALTKAQLEALEIPLPPLDEQKRIAAILDRADQLRQKRCQATELLDSLTQSIFLEMFGEHHPTGNNSTLLDIADIQIGYPFKSERYTEASDGINLCRGANILPNKMDWSDLAKWPLDQAPSYADYALEENDIVVAMDRPWISTVASELLPIPWTGSGVN